VETRRKVSVIDLVFTDEEPPPPPVRGRKGVWPNIFAALDKKKWAQIHDVGYSTYRSLLSDIKKKKLPQAEVRFQGKAGERATLWLRLK
jgi:hypothetical protein